MKRIITGLSTLALAATFQTAGAQDISINSNTIPGTVAVGDTAYIRMDVCNVGASPFMAAPANKIRTLTSVTSLVSIVKVTTDTLGTPMPASTWQQLSLIGNDIRLQYVPSMPSFGCSTYYIQVVALTAGTDIFTSTLQWNGPPAAGNLTANDNTTTGITVTLPLPVSLTNFTAVKKGSTSLLNWNTATEVNNAGFDIERSADGRSFSKIGVVYTKAEGGNSNEDLAYSYTDAKPLSGVNYYRLRQVDRDGKSVYSKVEQVSFDGSTGVKLYPNPATGMVTVEASDISAVSVFNMLGQRMAVPSAGKGKVKTLDVSSLAAGNYTVQVQDSSGNSTHKLSVVK